MCTLSWTKAGAGYELFFNRDERLTRGPERAPSEAEDGEVKFLAPRDADGGGTWIAVNDRGVTVCLLNGYVESRAKERSEVRSRGQLVLEAATLTSVGDALAHLATRDLTPYEPFVLCVFEPARGAQRAGHTRGPSARAFEWDGLELASRCLGPDDAPICSSGYDAAEARASRRAEWNRMRLAGPMGPERLIEFHKSHLDGPSAFSPCMHRADAETRSLVHVFVAPASVAMAHAAGSPCRTPLDPRLELPIREAPAGRRAAAGTTGLADARVPHDADR